MESANLFDDKMKQYFIETTENIDVPEDMFKKIKNKIDNRGEIIMRKNLIKRLMIVCVVCFTTAVTCIAAPKINSWISSSSRADGSNTFPSGVEIYNQVGYNPKYVEVFLNEFKFENWVVVNQKGLDVDGNSVIELKEFKMFYERENKNEKKEFLTLSTSTVSESVFNQSIQYKSKFNDKIEYNKLTLHYSEMPYKLVPDDYELTQQDKKDMEDRVLEISVGTEEIENNLMQCITWYEDGIQYDILGKDVNLTEDKFVEMAKTVINK